VSATVETALCAPRPREIVFIDGGIDDYQTLDWFIFWLAQEEFLPVVSMISAMVASKDWRTNGKHLIGVSL